MTTRAQPEELEAEGTGLKCSCGEPASAEPHTCPFQTELNDCDAECNCCAECEYQCSQDI